MEGCKEGRWQGNVCDLILGIVVKRVWGKGLE